MTSYEFERALVYIAEVIIKTFGKDVGVQEPKEYAEIITKEYDHADAIRRATEEMGEIEEIE